MSQIVARGKSGGRPPLSSSPKASKGKGRLLSANISQELRSALEDEAARTDKSISQVAERWMEEARNGRATIASLAGGYELLPVVQQLGAIARKIYETDNDPQFRWLAVEAAWKEALSHLVPAGPQPLLTRMRDEIERYKIACRELLRVVGEAGAEDPVFRAMTEGSDVNALLQAALGKNALPPAFDIIASGAKNGEWGLAALALKKMKGVGVTGARELAAVEASYSRLSAWADEVAEGKRSAVACGIEIAREAVGINAVSDAK